MSFTILQAASAGDEQIWVLRDLRLAENLGMMEKPLA
jgi:hypothetical protein